MEITKGSVVVVKKFIDAGSTRSTAMQEMNDFWKSITDEEKLSFTRQAVALMPELGASVR